MRSVLAVIGGYVVMFLWVFITLTVAWMLTGPGFAFEEGSTRTTTGWILINLVMSFLGALAGGWAAARIGSIKAARVLGGIVLGLGLVLAVMQMVGAGTPPEFTAGEIESMSAFEAASEAVSPVWYHFVIPVVGIVGILAGARLHRAPAAA